MLFKIHVVDQNCGELHKCIINSENIDYIGETPDKSVAISFMDGKRFVLSKKHHNFEDICEYLAEVQDMNITLGFRGAGKKWL